MSIFRTIKKLRDCDDCHGTGMIGDNRCPTCEGSGKVEYLSRVNQAAATRAEAATKQLPPKARQAAKARLQDHEPLAKGSKESKVGKDFVEEDE